MNEFRNLLSAFSIFSYTRERFSFSSTDVLEFIAESKKFEKLSVKDQDFFDDLVHAVCVLQREGLSYIFTHRSFQEYFTAAFLTRGKTAQLQDLLDWISRSRSQDNVIQMAFSIAPTLIEREWILPTLNKLLEKPFQSALDFSLKIGTQPHIFKDPKAVSVALVHPTSSMFIFLLPHLYPDFFLNKSFTEESKINDAKLLDERSSKEPIGPGEGEFFAKLSAGRFMEGIWLGCIALKSELTERHAATEQTISDILKGGRPSPTQAKSPRRRAAVARKR